MPKKLSIFKGRSKFRLLGNLLVELARKNPSLKAGTRNESKVSIASRRKFESQFKPEENSNNG